MHEILTEMALWIIAALELIACLLLANPLRSVLSALFIAAACLSGTGCTQLKVQKDGVNASYTTFEPFRLRNSKLTYDPATGEISADVSRQQAISPELMNAFGQAAGVAAGEAVKAMAK